MATRSTIALEYPGGKVGQVYCHWDGYLSNNGSILSTYWTSFEDINALIQCGDLSSLGVRLGQKHPFDAITKECTFYGRDRGEAGVSANFYATFDEFNSEADWQEFNYVFRLDGNWWVKVDDRGWMRLDAALAETLKG